MTKAKKYGAVYHASPTPGLRTLVPHVSTHGRAYVYAIDSRVTALLFGAPKDDFDLLIDTERARPVVCECYPEALRKVYAGKSCSLYTLCGEGFLSGQTGWEAELVCEHPVVVLQEERIADLYRQILLAAQQNECTIRYYSEERAYQQMLKDELSERIAAFGITDEQRRQDPRFQKYFDKLF